MRQQPRAQHIGKKRAVLQLFFLALGLFLTRQSAAQADFVGARGLGMGEAVRSLAVGGSGPLVNPAAMSLLRQYAIESQYGFRFEELGHDVNLSVVDSVTSRLAAGLFYSYVRTNPKYAFVSDGIYYESAPILREGHMAGLALSLPIGSYCIIGTEIKYLYFNTTATLPAGSPTTSKTFDSVNGVSFDAAFLLKFWHDRFRITTVGRNLWDHGSRELPLSLASGVSITPVTSLNIAFDAVVAFTGNQIVNADGVTRSNVTTVRFGPGLEYLIAKKVPIRAGYIYDSAQPASYFTAGIGFVSPRVAVDLGYRTKLQGGVDNYLLLGLRVFVN